MRCFRFVTWAAGAVVLASGLAASGTASAAGAGYTVADATYEAYLLNIDHGFTRDAYFQQGVYSGNVYGAETVSLSARPAPNIVTTVSGGDGAFDALGRINYYGVVLGENAEPGLFIPISVAYSLSGSGTLTGTDAYDGYETADLNVGGICQDVSCHLGFRADSNGILAPTSFAQSGLLHILVAPGESFQVVLEADSRFDCHLCAQPGHTGFGSGYAMIDPVFTIDPDFLAAHPGYSLAFSDGIGNEAAGVPEPAAWAMMICGLGLVGSRLRRRHAGRPLGA